MKIASGFVLAIVAVTLTALVPICAADSDSALERALAAAKMPNPLHLDLQRPIDPRLVKLETQGVEGCGLFKGEIHVVRNAGEVRALSGKLNPGDQLVLAGAEWKDARFTFAGSGTEAAPILIRPETPGSVVFSGESAVIFHGSHLVIHGLEFKKVALSKNGSVVFRLGNGKDRPADHCIVNRIKIEDCGSPSSDDWPRVKAWYLTTEYGHDNTLANSTFSGLRNIGQMVSAAELPPDGLQRLHILNNRFANRPYLDQQNGYEIIQIGWSAMKAGSAGSLIQGNTFEDCDGENEVISLKASDVVVRGNTFRGCQGVLSLRSTNRVLVQGNVFDGNGKTNTGGMTIEGSDHIVIGNTFRQLKKPRNFYFWAIGLLSASAENYGDNGDVEGYGRAKNILIAGNRFEKCDARIAVGCYPRPNYPLLPRDLHVRDNVFIGAPATSPFDYIAPDPTGELAKSLHEAGNQFEP